jgi:glycerol kinase
LFGITRATKPGHIARATLEAIALQVSDVMITKQPLRVDGGAARNDLLLQIQADVLKVPVQRRLVTEATAFGAALLAGIGAGIWKSLAELENLNPVEREFLPKPLDAGVARLWQKAVAATIDYARD